MTAQWILTGTRSTGRRSRLPSLILIFSATFLMAGGSAFSGSHSSSWFEGFHSRARLVSAHLLMPDNSIALYAGVDIELDQNWKTYWRSPGDAGGIPPEFDWSGSVNVKTLDVKFPAPTVLKDQYGRSIGYKNRVTFPTHVVPVDAKKPVKLKLMLTYGVCLDICIPAEASLKLDVAPGDRAPIDVRQRLMASLDRVPVSGDVKLLSAKAVLTGADPHLSVNLNVVSGARQVHLFVEAADQRFLPMAQPTGRGSDGSASFRIDLSGIDSPESIKGLPLVFTVVADGVGAKTSWIVP